MRITLTFYFLIFISLMLNAQDNLEKNDSIEYLHIYGQVRNYKTNQPLAYATVYVPKAQKGAISNEDGFFSIEIPQSYITDSIRFQYIGYQSQTVSITSIQEKNVIYLHEKIIDLSETVVYGTAPDAEDIVERIVDNLDKNYRKTIRKRQIFIRWRHTSEFKKFHINYKKNDIAPLSKEIFTQVEQNMPKITASYSDFLGNFYSNDYLHDDSKVKIDPIKMVMLKEKDIAELDNFHAIFQKEIDKTAENEYWNIRSGVFSSEINVNDFNQEEKDSLKKNKIKLSRFRGRSGYQMRQSSLKREDNWEFIHKTSRYHYKLVGGTSVDGEDVYVIDFTPGFRGKFQGRMYVSTLTYALIRADFGYAPGEGGIDISMLGVAFNDNLYKGSIYFEKDKNNGYVLKYYSMQRGSYVGFNRNIILTKKKSRFLLDKTQNKVKVRLDVAMRVESSLEIFVLENKPLSDQRFNAFEQPEYLQIHYVDQFDDDLWKGYSIIEPTKQMRDYKKRK